MLLYIRVLSVFIWLILYGGVVVPVNQALS